MIIDFRMRPPVGSYLPSAFGNVEAAEKNTSNLGFVQAPSVAKKSFEVLLEELKDVNVCCGVIPARVAAKGAVSNDEVAQLVQGSGGLFTGFAAFDPTDTEKALNEFERLVQKGPLSGVGFESGMLPVPLKADDPALFPLYDACQSAEIPVSIMAAAACGPDISFTSPALIDNVARAFPKLTIISAHGGWPWVTQNLYLAQRHSNVWLCPDFIMFNMPGMQDLWQAANYFLQDRFIFATGYPHVPHKGAVDFFMHHLRPEVVEKVMYKNALRLLKL